MKNTNIFASLFFISFFVACGGSQTQTTATSACSDEENCVLFDQIQIDLGDGFLPIFEDLSVLPAEQVISARAEGTQLARVPFEIERNEHSAEFYAENLNHEAIDIELTFRLSEDGVLEISSSSGGVVMNEASNWPDSIENVYIRATERRSEADLWTRILAADTELAEDAWRDQITIQTLSPTDSISLERSSCYGTCPDYLITVMGDGSISYEGHRFTLYVGETTRNINSSITEELFGAVGFMQPFIAPLNPDGSAANAPDAACREVTDLATATVRWNIGGISQEVVHYHGCNSYEFRRQLNALEDLIDLNSGALEWVGW